MRILGISAFYHDAAACLIDGNEILCAAQEERFSRKKHDPSFPTQAVRFCLEESGTALSDLKAVVFYDKPFLKLERLLETYYAIAPRGWRQFVAAMPVWIKEKMGLKGLLRDHLAEIDPAGAKEVKILFSEHHLSHMASAFYPSPFEKAAILTIDGVGEWATTSIGYGERQKIKVLRELHFPHSLGLLYSAFTYFLGFRVNSGEYKLMGLAPYGDPESKRFRRFLELISTELAELKKDGSLRLNMDFFAYLSGLKMVHERRWQKLFGIPRREPEGPFEQAHCDLALAIQRFTEEAVLRLAREAKRLTGARYLCLAGGVALNCVANGKLLRSGIFEDIWIQPAGCRWRFGGGPCRLSHLFRPEPHSHIE